MLRGISTYCYLQQRLHPGLLDTLRQGGADVLEIWAARQHFDVHDGQHVREIAGWFNDQGWQLHSLHSPIYFGEEFKDAGQPTVNIVHREKRWRIEAMDEIKRAIEIAEKLPFRYLVQHIGDSRESADPGKFDDAMTAIEHLSAFAKPLGVTLLLENIPNELSTPENLVKLIETAHFSNVAVCLDTGHAHMAEGVANAVEVMGPYIRSTHVHDNNGFSDTHLWPGEGSIDWGHSAEAIGRATKDVPFLLEVKMGSQPLHAAMSNAFERLSRSQA